VGRGLHLLQDLGRFVYVAFVVDVFAQRIVGWHAATTKVTDPGPDTTVDRVVGPGPAKGSRSSRVSCCTTPMPGASTHPSGSSAPRAGGHRSLDRNRG
jgi:hypothetical protein